jgi:hypothetical protein
MTDFKIKMAELAAKYNISHQRDIEWHNFVAEVEELKEDEHLLSAIQVQFASHAKVENGKRYAKLTWDEFKKIAFELCGRGKPKPAEQTEVDLEQEVISYFQGMWPGIDSNMPMKFMPPAIMRLVKHFYGLGKEQKPKVMQEVSDNVDKLRAISTPAEEDWFKVAEEWEKEDKKSATWRDELEKAADDHIRKVVDAAGHPGWDWETQDIAEAFIAGAEWQKEHKDDHASDH